MSAAMDDAANRASKRASARRRAAADDAADDDDARTVAVGARVDASEDVMVHTSILAASNARAP